MRTRKYGAIKLQRWKGRTISFRFKFYYIPRCDSPQKKKASEKKSKLKGMKNFWNVSMAKASLMKQHFSPAIRNFRSCNFQKLTHRAVIINYSWGTLCATIFRMRNEKGRICESCGVYRMKPRERDKLWMAKCFYGLMKFSFCDELCYVKLFL